MSQKCDCMSTNSGPGTLVSWQFPQLPCPCAMCKKRAKEQHKIRAYEIATSKNGICGQCINGMYIGTKTGYPFDEGCGCGGGNMSDKGPAQPTMWPQPEHAQPDECACANGSQGMGSENEPCQGPRMGSRMVPRNELGMALVRGPAMALGIGPGMAFGIGPGPGPGMGPRMGSITDKGQCPENCQCCLEYDQPEPNQIAFGGVDYARQSSMMVDDFQKQRQSGCKSSAVWSEYRNDPSLHLYDGRDTLGLHVYLQGKNGLLIPAGNSMCNETVCCDDNCGNNTGCNTICKREHSFSPYDGKGKPGGGRGGSGGNPQNFKSTGITICGNEYINMIVTFLMEVLGILVFFALCTLTFWITVGYYIVQLLVDLKNADRHVQWAISVALGLLIIAFAITLVTHGDGTCNIQPKLLGTAAANCNKCGKPAIPSVSKKSAPKARAKPFKRVYTDCEGRAIFDTSKRNAILIEMKQPPTWILWAKDCINSYLGRG